MAHTHDVVVVGARCGGAATAMLLADAGLDVVLVDRARLPSDTLSTHGLARGAVVQLARWGLLDGVLASGAPPIRTFSLHTPDGSTSYPIQERAGVDHLLAPRRYLLDAILLDAAVAAGATVRTGVSVTGTLTDATGRVVGVAVRERDDSRVELRARYVVGADGVRSRVARSVGARVVADRPAGSAARYAYVAGLDTDGYEVHLSKGLVAGALPTNGGEVAVWACSPADREAPWPQHPTDHLLDLLHATSPTFAARVRAGSIVSPVRAAVGLPNQVLDAWGPGWALVGDAGYHRDPISGHGITDAFRDAELLARGLVEVLVDGADERVALGAYAARRDRAIGPVFDLTWRMSRFPAAGEAAALQKQLGALLDAEAVELAALPPMPRVARLTAA